MAREPRRGQKKKLIDAGRHWAIGSKSYEDAIEQLEQLGAPDEVIDELRARQDAEDFEVWEDNWPAIEMFLRVQTQWRAIYGAYIGLDYTALYPMLDIYEVSDKKGILEAVQVVEIGVLDAMRDNKDE